MVLSPSELPQQITDLKGAAPKPTSQSPTTTPSSRRQAGQRQGMVFDLNALPQELKNLRDDAPPRNKTRPA
ncbi:hypothetical protein PCANC_15967 [Puccinia coronata f. sp. avenae]|nr:hypothetical protein PCANC_15967 [Puccinia coronata f. sp. avenae]